MAAALETIIPVEVSWSSKLKSECQLSISVMHHIQVFTYDDALQNDLIYEKIAEDGTFSLKEILPGKRYKVQLNALVENQANHMKMQDFPGTLDKKQSRNVCTQTEATIHKTCSMQTGPVNDSSLDPTAIVENLDSLNCYEADYKMQEHIDETIIHPETSTYIPTTGVPSDSGISLYTSEQLENLTYWQATTQQQVSEDSTGSMETTDQANSTELMLYTCTVCKKLFNKRRLFSLHMLTHEGVDIIPCDQCHKKFKEFKKFDRHKKQTHKCTKQMYKKSADFGVKHEEDMSGCKADDTSSCKAEDTSDCKAEDTKDYKADAGTDLTAEGLRLICTVCGVQFDNRRLFNEHVRGHEGNAIIPCDECPKKFTEFKKFDRHKKQTHRRITSYTCGICQSTFTNTRKFRVHEMSHKGQRPFDCEICGKAFSRRQILLVHKLRHSDTKNHVCEVCGHSCRTAGALKSHKQTHGDARPFSCTQCGRSFKHKSGLRQHWLIHSNERRHCCEVCGMSFRRHEHLKEHQRIHTGERPFQCSECKRAFTTRSTLLSHKRTHTGEKPHVCFVCSRGFAQSHQLKMHLNTHLKKSSVKAGQSTNSALLPGLDVTKPLAIPQTSHTQ